MIFIGYQGIGKSSVAKKFNPKNPSYQYLIKSFSDFNKRFIDLKISDFKYGNPPKKDKNWYKPYVNIAISLNEQGFNVFLSSHKKVREYLKELNYTDVRIITPSLELKDKWLEKLENRYKQSKDTEDYFEFLDARDKYDENIKDLINSGFRLIVINTTDYLLEQIVTDNRIKNNSNYKINK